MLLIEKTDSNFWDNPKNESKQGKTSFKQETEEDNAPDFHNGETALRVWFKWCLYRKSISDLLLFVHNLLQVPSDCDGYSFDVLDLLMTLVEYREDTIKGFSSPLPNHAIHDKLAPKFKQTLIDVTGQYSSVTSNDIIIVILTELDRLTCNLKKLRKENKLSELKFFLPFQLDLKLNTLVLCIELINVFVLSLLKLNDIANNGNEYDSFVLPKAFGNDKECNAEYFVYGIISLLRIFISQCSQFKSLILYLKTGTRLPIKLQLNEDILNKLGYLEQMLLHSGVFATAKSMLENNNNDDSKKSKEEEKNKITKCVDVAKQLSKAACGLCFDLMVSSPDKKLTLFRDMTTKCVENCKVELI